MNDYAIIVLCSTTFVFGCLSGLVTTALCSALAEVRKQKRIEPDLQELSLEQLNHLLQQQADHQISNHHDN
jgi:hypothetical protein